MTTAEQLLFTIQSTQKQTNLGPKVIGRQNVFVLSSRGSPGMVELETLVAEVGLAVGAALGGF